MVDNGEHTQYRHYDALYPKCKFQRTTSKTDITLPGTLLCDECTPIDFSSLSPISEGRGSEFSDGHVSSDEETKDVESSVEDDLKSLDGMVNFRISEILPSGMTPLDNSRNCQNGSDEPPMEENPVLLPEYDELPLKLDNTNPDCPKVPVVHAVKLGTDVTYLFCVTRLIITMLA